MNVEPYGGSATSGLQLTATAFGGLPFAGGTGTSSTPGAVGCLRPWPLEDIVEGMRLEDDRRSGQPAEVGVSRFGVGSEAGTRGGRRPARSSGRGRSSAERSSGPSALDAVKLGVGDVVRQVLGLAEWRRGILGTAPEGDGHGDVFQIEAPGAGEQAQLSFDPFGTPAPAEPAPEPLEQARR